MKKTKQKNLKDFAKKSINKVQLKKIKGGTDVGGENTDGIVTEDIMHM